MRSMSLYSRAFTAALSVSSAFALIDHGFSHEQLADMRQRMYEKTHASWEYGTAVQAILELDFPDVSVYGPAPFPPPRALDQADYPVLIGQQLVDNKPAHVMALMEDGAAADPMSNGISVLLANHTFPDDPRYNDAFLSQLYFIEHMVPRTGDGAISHRTSEVQLWADSVFMVPPVLAYYGAIHPDPDESWRYLVEAYNQCRIYRDYLRNPDAGNVWHHVVLGSWSDTGHWATGQGWAASGMLRVHQTIAKSRYRDQMQWALQDLTAWTEEIVAGTWSYQKEDGSLWNYLDRSDSFVELSATCLMAASTYRLASITNATHHVPNADRAFALVKENIQSDGRLDKVVNPYNFSDRFYDVSPEGQAMCLMLQAAFRDHQAFRNGINGLGNVLSAFSDVIAAVKESAKTNGTESEGA